MKERSIRSCLFLGINLIMILVLAGGSVIIYRTMSKSFYKQLDQDLERTFGLIASEVEITGDHLDNEWLGHL